MLSLVSVWTAAWTLPEASLNTSQVTRKSAPDAVIVGELAPGITACGGPDAVPSSAMTSASTSVEPTLVPRKARVPAVLRARLPRPLTQASWTAGIPSVPS